MVRGDDNGLPGSEYGCIVMQNRLWTPWRMQYIAGGVRELGCIFCNRRDTEDDVAGLVLYRGTYSYIIMNLFPYNTGHVMIVPNDHTATLDLIDDPTLIEMARMAPPVTAALRRVLNCDGFNLGLNLGAVAGAGVADHLHQHIVPRWTGDANFMPILASTMVMPELLPATYAKARAELNRELGSATSVASVVLVDGARSILLRDGHLPLAEAETRYPLWLSAIELVGPVAGGATITGWAGELRGTGPGPSAPVLTIRARGEALADGWEAVSVEHIERRELDPEEIAVVEAVLATVADDEERSTQNQTRH